MKFQFEKERHTLLGILQLFTNVIHELSSKNAWLPPIFFLDFNNTKGFLAACVQKLTHAITKEHMSDEQIKFLSKVVLATNWN